MARWNNQKKKIKVANWEYLANYSYFFYNYFNLIDKLSFLIYNHSKQGAVIMDSTAALKKTKKQLHESGFKLTPQREATVLVLLEN